MADRVDAVRQIAIAKRGVTPRLTKAGYLRGERRRVRPRSSGRTGSASSIEGFLFPATYEFTKLTSSQRLVSRPARGRSGGTGGRSTSRYARSKNLTPYDVLIIASMIEKETVVAERAEARRGGDLQPAAQPDAARDRRDDPLRARRAGNGAAQAVATSRATTRTTRATASGCRRHRSRTRASLRCAPPRIPRAVDYLYFVRKGESEAATSSRRARPSSAQKSLEYGFGGC